MAEFSLGLTKTAVEGTLSLVKSAIEEEKKLKEKVQNDLVFITGEFEVMQSFLQDANRERARNDKVTLSLVRQLRTLAFDVEDCVEYVVHLDLDKSSILGGLRRLWQMVKCRAPPLPLDVAVAEIKQLKARVEDVSQRNARYNLILHDSKKQQQLVTVMLPRAEEPPYAATTTTYPSTAFHDLRDAWKATGKWSYNMCNLQQELLIGREGEGDHDLRFISIWGSSSIGGGGSSGTASILNKAYCDLEICEYFKIRAWVKLTHPFNHDEFIKSLLAQFCASNSHQEEVVTQDNLNLMKANLILQKMREQRYLLVLEDVLTVAEWHLIRKYLADSKNGSRILLSTPRLGIALLCTGEPYQVSELRNFAGDNQLLCAFSKKEKTPREIGEFVHQLLRRHGVISMWGADDDDKSNLVDILYKGIINGWLEEIEGFADMLYKQGIRNKRGKIERHSSWVDVPDPFDLKVFAQRLFLNFYSDDIQAKEITKVGKKRERGLIEWCRKFLSEEEDYHYVVVINGVRSKDDWDLIQSKFFSSKTATGKGCILVITNEESVATHCVKDCTYLAFNAKDLRADPSISALINKGCWHYAIRGKKGRLFYDRRKDAQEWANKFQNVGGINLDEGKDEEEGFLRVCRVTVDTSCGKGFLSLIGYYGSERGVLRHAYYGALFQQQIERRSSWVDLPMKDLDLTDFSWNLLLDFYSDDPQEKETIAVGLMEGTIDPIEKCCEFLHNDKCLVVITRVWSRMEWDSIKDTFFTKQHIQSIVMVGSSQEFKYFETTKVLQLGTHEQCRLIDMEYRRILSTQKRYQEAIQWVETGQLVGRDREVSMLRFLGNPLSVWGIPGVGKSTLVRTAYYNTILDSSVLDASSDSILRPYNYQAFGWVDVPSPFNLTEFAWRLLLDFYYEDPQAKETAVVSMMEEGCQVPILECCKILRTEKCLVVMDGLRSQQDWNLIKATFLAEPIQATVVVITDEEELAMHCAKNHKKRAINITRLEANATISLFKKIASKEKDLNHRRSRLKEFKSIADKCGGLPKVIVSIGECNPYWALRSLRDNFMGTLETDPDFHGLRPLLSWMKSYFDACSDSIKPCIFYLSIFSAEKNTRLRRLLWRWIAESYCRDTSDGRTSEENGGKFISELVNLSIIQESPSSKVFYNLEISKVFCQINGFFHEYIISRPMEDNLVFALEKGCSLNSTRAGQHLTIRSTWDRRDRIVYESIDFSRLRSLTVFGKWESFFICSKNVKMRLLRVLDLEDATHVTNEDLEEIAKLLPRLKFLSLRGCREITRLPSSIGGLRQLQTLDVRHTCVLTLPPIITKLQKLRYIRAGITTEEWDWEGDVLLLPLPADEEEDRATEGGRDSTASSSADEEEDRASAAADEEDRASAAAAAQVTDLLATEATPTPPTEGGRDSTASSAQVTAAATIGATPNASLSVSCYNRCHTLVASLLCRSGGLDNGAVTVPATGVMVPEDIGKLSAMHTLGAVKVNAQCSKAVFQELKKLRQLRKLGVSGINKGNIHEFCEAISGHAHLKSLSVELDNDDDLDDNIPHPPKTIKSLKLYGRVHKLLPVWLKHLKHLNCLEKLHLTIEKPEELQDQQGILYSQPYICHLRIRPIGDSDLHIMPRWKWTSIVEIQCSSRLHIKFYDRDRVYFQIKVLKVHFAGGSQSSLEISGLSELWKLKEVWLKGYTDAHKQDMQRQIDDMEMQEPDQERPVLKLVQPRLS